MFERPKQTGRRAVLVHVVVVNGAEGEELDEFRELALSAKFEPVATITASLRDPNPKFLIGSGKLQEIHALALEHQAELVLFNHVLSPSQERNIERELQCHVLDRTGLILDIFAQRARSHEGRLQVAHRLSWTEANGPIPDGLYALHKCDNPSCINPDHLFLGTYSDNLRDAWAKGRNKGNTKKSVQP